ncbi:MAG TPA: class I SAM-dependent methyltransferase [Gemmatimonadales bacterium]|nr:class I SAM-dependent methyltransferase [Gemmatimonadales bacterium]
MPVRSEDAAVGGWERFDRDARRYEDWYTTPRGQRADRAERALLDTCSPHLRGRAARSRSAAAPRTSRALSSRLPHVLGIDGAAAILTEARRRHPSLPLVQGDAHRLPIRDRAVDLGVFIATLEFVDRPAVAMTEAIRIARRGVLVIALNRWSLGGLSRRCGADTRRRLLGHARDFSPPSLRALAFASAGPRLGHLRGRAPCFPDTGSPPQIASCSATSSE